MSSSEDLWWEVRRRIDNGRKTRIWEDQWLPNNHQRKPKTLKPANRQIDKVADMIVDYRWNRPLICKMFCKEDADNILKVPISITRKEDSRFWLGNQTGEYTVQSGYKHAMERREVETRKMEREAEPSCNSINQHVWKVLWNLNINHKIKLFIWKGLREAVPIKKLIWRRAKARDRICSGCGKEMETLEHMLLNCRKVRGIWKLAPIQWDVIGNLTGNFKNWWTVVTEAR